MASKVVKKAFRTGIFRIPNPGWCLRSLSIKHLLDLYLPVMQDLRQSDVVKPVVVASSSLEAKLFALRRFERFQYGTIPELFEEHRYFRGLLAFEVDFGACGFLARATILNLAMGFLA